jgi:hypothetical protein
MRRYFHQLGLFPSFLVFIFDIKFISIINYFIIMKTKLIATLIIFLNITFNLNSQSSTFEWAKSIGGIRQDYSSSVVVDSLGNSYISGVYRATVDFDPGPGVYSLTAVNTISGSGFPFGDLFILKLDPSGNFVWVKTIEGPGHSECKSMRLDKKGNIYLTGLFTDQIDCDPGIGIFNLSCSVDSTDAMAIKLNPNGDLLWAKQLGSNFRDGGGAMDFDSNSNVYFSGLFNGTVDFDPSSGVSNLTAIGRYDSYIVKFDSNGNFVWVKSIEARSTESGHDIAVDKFNNIYYCGDFEKTIDFDPGSAIYNLSPIGLRNSFLLKLDQNGDFIWVKSFVGTVVGDTFTTSSIATVVTDFSGNLYVIGTYSGNIDFDPNSGVNAPANSNFKGPMYISKLDNDGNLLWVNRYGDSLGRSIPYNLSIDHLGNVYATGSYFGSMDFDLSSGTNIFTAFSNADNFIMRVDSLGNDNWAAGFGGNGMEWATECAIDRNGNVYTTGVFWGTSDFDPSSNQLNFTSLGSRDCFIHKMSQPNFLGLENPKSKNTVTIFPNPNNGQFTIQSKTKGNYFVLNELGQVLQTFQTNGENKYSVDLKGLANGIYFLKGKNGEQLVNEKIVVNNYE